MNFSYWAIVRLFFSSRLSFTASACCYWFNTAAICLHIIAFSMLHKFVFFKTPVSNSLMQTFS